MNFFNLQTAQEAKNAKELTCWVDDFLWISNGGYLGSIDLSKRNYKKFIDFLDRASRSESYIDITINRMLFALEDADEGYRNLVVHGKNLSMIYNFPHRNLPKLVEFLKSKKIRNETW